MEPNKMLEVEEIIEKQKMLDDLISANTDSIKRIDSEIEEMGRKSEYSEKNTEVGKEIIERNVVIKSCRYFNKGYCKYLKKCRYFHSNKVCKKHLENLRCTGKGCRERHPKMCKWYQKEIGCKRIDCEFLHVTLASKDGGTNVFSQSFTCAGCKDVWQDEKCVVKHVIKHKELFFCLNCDDYITNKSGVLDSNWTLLDQHGNIRGGV